MERDILELQMKIIPEMIEVLEKRYTILRTIYYNQPIGRRGLASLVMLGERIVRSEITLLKDYGLIDIFPQGMIITEEGNRVVLGLEELVRQIRGLSELEKIIEKKLRINKVVIVPGDADKDISVLNNIGKTAANYIKSIIEDGISIAVTGGSTVAQVAEEMPKIGSFKNIVVTPARGGLGRDMENQANTVAAKLATKLGGSYKLLHVPDNLSREALGNLMDDPTIRDVIETIKATDLLLYGIGKAEELAKRRGLDQQAIDELVEKGAVAEAFGYYFDKNGEIVYRTNTVALELSIFNNIKNTVAVAGGKSKAWPIIAVTLIKDQSALVTDEGAAREILRILG